MVKNPNRFQESYMHSMPDDIIAASEEFSTMSCTLSQASLVRVIYSFGWHHTSLPVIASSGTYSAYGFRRLPNYLIRFWCIHSTEPFCPMTTVFILSNPAVLLFYSIAVRFLSKVTELPISGLNNLRPQSKNSLLLHTPFKSRCSIAVLFASFQKLLL